MHKTLAIIDHDAELKDIVERLQTMREMAEEKAKFLQKQLADFMETESEKIKPIWSEITQYLQNKGRLPADFCPDKYSIHLDREDGTVVLCDGHDQTPSFLKALGIELK